MIPTWIISWIAPIIVRYIVAAASGYLIKKGWGQHIDWASVSAGLVGFVGSLGWAVQNNKTPNKVAGRLQPHVDGPEGHSQPQI
jgi:hypothetical protein